MHLFIRLFFLVLCLGCPTWLLGQAGQAIWDSQNATLGESHGNNFIRGRHNSIHLTYTLPNGDLVYHRGEMNVLGNLQFANSPADPRKYYKDGSHNYTSPAIAEDHKGNLGFVAIVAPSGQTHGSLYYFYRNTINDHLLPPSPSTNWNKEHIAENVARPAIAISQKKAHLTWEDNQGRIRYVQFDAQTPFFVGNSAEIALETTCPLSSYTKPSITVLCDPCKPDRVRIAALFSSTSSSSTQFSCAAIIGPEVRERDGVTTNWSTIFQDFETGTSFFPNREPTSISMSSHYLSGVTHLAYSYEFGQQAKTKLAVTGRQGPWQTTVLDPTEAKLIHVITNYFNGASEFRIASQGSAGSTYETGKWHPNQSSPTWLNTIPIQSGIVQFRNPQAIFWRYCLDNRLNLHWVAEPIPSTGGQTIPTELHPDWSIDTGCDDLSMIAKINCSGAGTPQAFVAHRNGYLSAELHDLGAVQEIGEGFAVFANGHDKFYLSWQPGRLLGYWESGLRLKGNEPFEILSFDDAPQAEIIFESDVHH